MKTWKSYTKGFIFSLVGNDINLKKKLDYALKNNHLVILNLHKISPQDSSSWKALDPNTFRALLNFISKNFEVLTFKDIEKAIVDASNRPRMILSFDDGYKNFIEYAMPILADFKIKVNQNIIPNCSLKGVPPLNVIAQDWIGQAPMNLIQKLDIPEFSLPSGIRDKTSLGNKISQFLKFKPFEQQQEYSKYLLPQFEKFDKFQWTKIMGIEEIRSIIPDHEIGLHSMNHESMNVETDEYFKKDVTDCLKFANEQLKIAHPIYAFPNGAFRINQIEILRQSGFRQMLLVGDKVSNTKNDCHYRFNFHADCSTEAKYKATGNLLSIRKK